MPRLERNHIENDLITIGYAAVAGCRYHMARRDAIWTDQCLAWYRKHVDRRLQRNVGAILQAYSSDGVAAAADHGREREIDALHRRCGVYTKPVIVRRILDAVGWKHDTDLSRSRLLEPAAGNGEFVVEAARRLVASCRRLGVEVSAANLSDRIEAFELHPGAADEARSRVEAALRELKVHHRTAEACAKAWVVNADFLLTAASSGGFTHAVGNPPYIRWSKIPANLKATYDDRLPRDMTGGDLFLPFLDHALEQLRSEGHCGFLCSDRWRFMAFAEAFRRKWLPALDVIAEDVLSADEAFVSNVDSYPTILIASKRSKTARTASGHSIRKGKTLEELGYIVKVGPALGHTPAFVLQTTEDDVEPELLHPWIDSSEIVEGTVHWRGRRIVAMDGDDGKPVDLKRFPMLATRLERFASELEQRSIVRHGAEWYRTIDRVRAGDWGRPKLVVPELAKIPRLAVDRSGAIPSHGVYAIFAPDDDVDALYAKLSDGRLARALEGISPKVKGGYVRCYKRFLLSVRLSEN